MSEPYCLACLLASPVPAPVELDEARYTARDLADAYAQGVTDERTRSAAARTELAEAWIPVGRRTYEQKVRERSQRTGELRRDHPGGPVDFETGRPLRRRPEVAA